jgi:hypothetical protein
MILGLVGNGPGSCPAADFGAGQGERGRDSDCLLSSPIQFPMKLRCAGHSSRAI